jgi:ParB family chromosome partitioning protein
MDLANEKALNVALNKVSGDWDIPLLTELLKDISANGFDVSLTGFDAAEMDSLFRDSVVAGVKEDSFDEPLPEKPISRQGDIWLWEDTSSSVEIAKADTYTALMTTNRPTL